MVLKEIWPNRREMGTVHKDYASLAGGGFVWSRKSAAGEGQNGVFESPQGFSPGFVRWRWVRSEMGRLSLVRCPLGEEGRGESSECCRTLHLLHNAAPYVPAGVGWRN